jgi:predicted acetyltransferase
MNLTIRSCREDEIETFVATCVAAFHDETSESWLQRDARMLETERALIALDEDVPVGTAAAYRFDLSIPGGSPPVAGVTLVGVLPSHRRRGVLTALMRRQLEDAHAWKEPLAALWCSESNIYQRFGYGMATRQAFTSIERDRALFRVPREPVGRVRLLDVPETLKTFPRVYERVRAQVPGMPSRTPEWWETYTLADDKEDREGGGPMGRALLEVDGRAEAYALYRMKHSWDSDHLPAGTLTVLEAMATSTRSVHALWSFLFGIDLVARIEAHKQPADWELILMLAEFRRLRFTLQDGLWVRIVDVDRALSARSYAGDGALVLALVDHFCPWNEGTWKLVAGSSGASVERTSQAPDLKLDAAALGAAYLGGVSFGELQRAGDVRELRPGAVELADALFRSDRAPWCPEEF